MRKPRQTERVLAMLAQAGSRGVHSFEMRRALIGNPSQRIADLEGEGHKIRTGDRERLHGEAWGVRWFLVERAAKATTEGVMPGTSSLSASDTPASSPSAPVLFEVPPVGPRNALLDDEAAA